MIITFCWPVVNWKLTGVPGQPHLSFMGSLFETQTRIHKTIRSNTCPQAWQGGHFYSLSPAQFRDELLCSPGRAGAKFHQPDQAPGASFPSGHRPDCFCPSHRHHVSTSWVGRSKGKPRSSTEVFKYQLWNFSHQPSECLTAYTKQTSFGGEWKVPVVVCSANQQRKAHFWEQEHSSGLCSKPRWKAVQTQGVSGPQPHSKGGDCLSALARPPNYTKGTLSILALENQGSLF